jgi:hypothetical protein
MERIVIYGGKQIPSVILDADKGILEIAGRSTPENADELYGIILFGIQNYLSEGHDDLHVSVNLEYFNTSTARQLSQIFKLLGGKKCSVKWIYEEGDEDMKEAGEDFRDMNKNLEFNFEKRPE